MDELLAKLIAVWLAGLSPDGAVPAQFLSAYDGDSLTVGFACSGPVTATISFSGLSMTQVPANARPLVVPVACKRGMVPLTVRVAGIDAPELSSSCETASQRAAEKKRGYAVRDTVTAWLRRSGTVVLDSIDPFSEKWGRTLARVGFGDGSGQLSDLGVRLILRGEARAYSGGTKQSWCDLS